MNLPCEPNTPNNPLFQVLVGRAPDMVPTTMGYLEPISSPPQMCISCSVWVQKPVTDVILKNISERPINLTSPHSVAITTHESFIPTEQSTMEIQHQGDSN